jgi:predicted nuclease of predicted toxin-antitoxin system
MILIDYSQVALANILSFKTELTKGSEGEIKNLIRHCVLSSIKFYKKKYSKEYGEVVICCDGKKYWRKDFFPLYKASRKKNREASDLDWKLIFDTMSEIRDDIKNNFPYRVLHIERAEADDVIAVISAATNEFGRNENVMIISSDKDFKQLHAYSNVKQFSPIQKKQVTIAHKEIHPFTIEHVVKGDAGDGIPNILSDDDIFTKEGRQTPVSSKRLKEFIEKGFDACRNDSERRNWHRNQTLVDFKYIPEDVQKEILDTYELNKPVGDKMSIMNYLMEHRCNMLLDELEDF